MNEQIFKEKMADILYRDDIPDLDTPLNEIEEWNSVAYLAFVAMAKFKLPIFATRLLCAISTILSTGNN